MNGVIALAESIENLGKKRLDELPILADRLLSWADNRLPSALIVDLEMAAGELKNLHAIMLAYIKYPWDQPIAPRKLTRPRAPRK
jgi:hypothetical protein